MKLATTDTSLIAGKYIPSNPDNVLWGEIPSSKDGAIARLASGEIVTIDTVSHEGMMEDQGRDPVAWFASRGVDPSLIPNDVIDIARDFKGRNAESEGPHIVTGPIEIVDALPGDIIKVDFLVLEPRVPFGVVSSRHGFGALAGEYPTATHLPLGDPAIEAPGMVCVMCELDLRSAMPQITIQPRGGTPPLQFPFAPFLGLIGVTPDSTSRLNSIPPGDFGGNMDIRNLVVGSSLYLPVQVPGAGLFMGDPHFAQGHGEVALTAVEASLRATLMITLIKSDRAKQILGSLTRPFAEDDSYWYCVGMDRDLNTAMRSAVREAIRFINERFGIQTEEAVAYLSAATDFVVTQVVDDVKGIHCQIRKADFRSYSS